MAAQEGGASTQPVSALVRSTYLRLMQQTALTVRLLPPHPPPPHIVPVCRAAIFLNNRRPCGPQNGNDTLQVLRGLGSDDTVDLLQLLNSTPAELAR